MATAEDFLEIAAGTGIIAIHLSIRIANITAIDIAPEVLDVTQKLAKMKGRNLAQSVPG